MGLFRRTSRDDSERSEIEQERAELEVESALIHVKILAHDLMDALNTLESSVKARIAEDAPTEPEERNEPPF